MKTKARRTASTPEMQEGPAPRLTYLVGRLDRALRKRLSEALRPFDLSIAQYTMLSVLKTRAGLSNAQLASRAFISAQAANEVMQTLEARKLVTRRPDSSHGRIVQLLLTAQGTQLAKQCDGQIERLEETMLAGLTESERVSLRTAISTCTRMLEDTSPATPGED
jgi:DNA-binding MarR family transcriptional regulator